MARTPKSAPPPRTVEGADDEHRDDDELIVVNSADDDAPLPGEHVNGAGAVEESVESLREQLASEREAREAAESRARDATSAVGDTRTALLDSNMQVIENALAKEDGIKKDLKSRITAAKEAGNYAEEIDLTDQLQQANLRINRMNEGKTELERRREEIRELPTDPVELYVKGMAPRSADWVRSHPEYVTDEAKRSDLEAAHFNALGKKLVAGSPQYFAAVEAELGLGTQPSIERDEPRRNSDTTGQRRPPSAPPSRASVSSSGAGLPAGVEQRSDGKYRLTPALREAARISGLSDADYLKNLLELHQEGRITH